MDGAPDFTDEAIRRQHACCSDPDCLACEAWLWFKHWPGHEREKAAPEGAATKA